MGKIEKEKLLEEFRGIGSMYLSDVRRVIKNFPEEQEIDFDALWKEYEEKYSCKKTTNCDNCTYPNKLYYTTICFVDFLKSKNLTVPKLVEIPVKKTWTLKKHVKKIFHDFGNTPYPRTSDPPENLKKYYDLHEEPDYSKIPNGSIVEISDGRLRKVSKFVGDILYYYDSNENFEYCILTCYIKRIVELAKE